MCFFDVKNQDKPEVFMAELVKVALDAMGGDNAPYEIVKGAVDALKASDNVSIYLVGYEDKVNATVYAPKETEYIPFPSFPIIFAIGILYKKPMILVIIPANARMLPCNTIDFLVFSDMFTPIFFIFPNRP